MSIFINKDTKVITQGITGKTGQFHTKMGKEYANGRNCYVAGVNRVGEGGGLRYEGDSVVVSPWGKTLIEAGAKETVLFADVDPAAVADARAKFPALSDRRPEAYRR